MANAPTERKVIVATAASGTSGAAITLVMYLLSLIHAVGAMPDYAKAALLVIVTGVVTTVATLVAGWWAKHTPRPEGS